MRLSVFRGGFTREAAEAVAGASLRTLTALVDKSLVRVDANGRYDIHELLRQYAEERLNETGDNRHRPTTATAITTVLSGQSVAALDRQPDQDCP